MLKKFRYAGLAAVFMVSIMLAACGSNDDNGNEGGASSGNNGNNGNNGDSGVELGDKDITLPYVAWAGETARTPLLGKALEDVGYNVEITQVEAGPMWASVADDKDTFTASAWLPTTHKEYMDKYKDDVEVYDDTPLIDKAPLALTVPEYVDVDSIEDLKGNKELGEAVDWTITGIDAGAGIMNSTEKAIDNYDLDKWKLQASSESAMISELQKKIKKKEPIIITGWKPHWIYAEMDLKMLEDPDEIYGGDGDEIVLVFNKDFKEAHPAAYKIATQFAQNYDEDDEDELMGPIFGEDKDAGKVAEQFMKDHPDQVKKWEDGVASE